MVEQWVKNFESRKLCLHQAEVTCEAVELLGCSVDGAALRMEISGGRLRKVQAGVRGLLERRKVTGWSIEVVVGHLTFCGLSNRGLLTALRTVYTFIRRRYLEPKAKKGFLGFLRSFK